MKTHIEIHAANLVHNLRLFHRRTGKQVMFVVKANAYGHGLKEIVAVASRLPCVSYFVVDSLEEALQVKKEKVPQRIMVIGWLDRQELEELARHGFETVAASLDHYRQIRNVAKAGHAPLRVHVKVETGTMRLGMDPAEAVALINGRPDPYLRLVGIYSHFANIEDTTDPSYARMQMSRFAAVVKKTAGKSLLHHFSCSASALLFPETFMDMVRVGISAYGYWPSKQTYVSYLEKHGRPLQLKKVLSWHTRVAQVKHLPKRTPIGYGLTYKSLARSRIAVLPVGYYDGLDRRLSNLGRVLVKGEPAPIRGRICMDMCMVDVTHIRNVRMGDRVLLIGAEAGEEIDAGTIADAIGTIHYEVLARINPLLPRRVS